MLDSLKDWSLKSSCKLEIVSQLLACNCKVNGRGASFTLNLWFTPTLLQLYHHIPCGIGNEGSLYAFYQSAAKIPLEEVSWIILGRRTLFGLISGISSCAFSIKSCQLRFPACAARKPLIYISARRLSPWRVRLLRLVHCTGTLLCEGTGESPLWVMGRYGIQLFVAMLVVLAVMRWLW